MVDSFSKIEYVLIIEKLCFKQKNIQYKYNKKKSGKFN